MHPVRGDLIHLDCLEVKLDEAIQADVALELLGTEDAPGVVEGGVLEHVTREITIEALPTDIPEVIHADASGMSIGDTLQLSMVPRPRASRTSPTTPRRSRSRPCRRRASRRSPSPSSRRRPSSSARTASRSRARRLPRARRALRPRARRGRTRGRPGLGRRGVADLATRPSARPRRGRFGPRLRIAVLVVGLGNPGSKYAGSRHNAGAEVAAELARRWELPRARQRFRGRIADGRAGPGGPRVSVLVPETFMNESGDSVAPARGSLKIAARPRRGAPRRDRPAFRRDPSRLGGGLAGPQRASRVSRGLGGPDFWRVRVGVGRPDTTDPEIVSAHVLGRFTESDERGPRPDRRRAPMRRRASSAGSTRKDRAA